MSKLTGAGLVVKTLEALGVEKVFGIPGVHNLDIYDHLIDSAIEHVAARHEQGAGFMADGYARQTGHPGVCLVITGPGLTNISTAVAQAYSDSVPLLLISSQVPEPWRGKNRGYLHELENSTYFAASFVKESRRVPGKELIGFYIQEAYALANSDRKGPVHVEIPMDLLSATLAREYQGNTAIEYEMEKWHLSNQKEALEEAVKTLHAAKDRVIIAGSGAANAREELLALSEKMEAPIITTTAGKGSIPEDHDFCLGARLTFPPVKRAIRKAETILAVGTELAHIDLHREVDFVDKLIHVDIDPRNRLEGGASNAFICGDAKMVLGEMLERWDTYRTNPGDRQGETKDALKRWCKDVVVECREMLGKLTHIQQAELNASLALITAIREQLSEEEILIADMVTPGYLAVSEYPAYQPATFVISGNFGTLGYALPSAIGATLAKPEMRVVVMVGDGGFQFTMQELGVIAQYDLPIKIIIWNNRGYGEIKRNQEARHPGQTIAVEQVPPEFKKLAEAYNIQYYEVAADEHMRQNVKQGLKEEGPKMIEINLFQ